MTNQFAVGAVGKKIRISNLAPQPSLTPREALELAAWLVAAAAPLERGSAGQVLDKLHQLIGDAASETDNGELEEAAKEQIEE